MDPEGKETALSSLGMQAGRQKELQWQKEKKSFFKNIKRYWFYNYFLVIPSPLCIWNFHCGDKEEKTLKQYREIRVPKWEIKVYLCHTCKLVLCQKAKKLGYIFQTNWFHWIFKCPRQAAKYWHCLNAWPEVVSTWHEHRQFFCKLLGSLNSYGCNPKWGKLPGPWKNTPFPQTWQKSGWPYDQQGWRDMTVWVYVWTYGKICIVIKYCWL